MKIGDLVLPCAVLEDGTRVLSETGVVHALGLYRSGAVQTREKEAAGGGAQMPLFVANKNIKPFVDKDLASVLQKPIWYKIAGSGRNKGFDATLLPKICDVWLKARDARVLRGTRQPLVAETADILMRGLAHIGITALVDEATGYQYDRPRRALEEILEAFISKELVKWIKMFPDEFYQELFRLRNWKFSAKPSKRPALVGKLTLNLVYKRLAPGVLEELKRLTPRTPRGRPKHKLFMRLTQDVGHPKLREHLASVIALMKSSDDWPDFYRRIERALPRYSPMPLFDKMDGLQAEVVRENEADEEPGDDVIDAVTEPIN